VVIQSFYTDHYALRFAGKQDYAGFYRHEVEFRRLLGYPPFTRLVQVLVSNSSADKAYQISDKIAAALRLYAAKLDMQRQIRILGPAAAPLEKLRGKHRVQVLIKVYPGGDATALLGAAFRHLGEHRVSRRGVSVDVDPVSML
jgi:primosomal protein N' (replication factor Y)